MQSALPLTASEHTRHVVIDGSNMLHRVLHVPSLQNLKTSDGRYTGGVYGFLKTLRVVVKEFAYLGSASVVWDVGLSNRRQSLYPAYKDRGERSFEPIMLEDGGEFDYLGEYFRQRIMVDEALEYLGVRTLAVVGREADDIIAYAADSLKEPVVVVSEDKDFWQLASDRVSIFRPIAEQMITPEFLQGEFGFGPDRYLIYHAILGDGSDNIPGIEGVGPSTAKIVVQSAPDLSGMAVFAETHKHARVRKVWEGMENVLRNLELVDLRREKFEPLQRMYIDAVLQEPAPPVRVDELARCATIWEMKSIYDHPRSWLEPFLDLR